MTSFGELVPCRTCRGTGESRNPEWGDKQLARERARRRRHGEALPKPTALTACVECAGVGYLPPPIADSERDDRDRMRPGW